MHRRLFHWTAQEVPLFHSVPCAGNLSGVSRIDEKGRAYQLRPVPETKAIRRSDTNEVLGIFKEGYQPHQPGAWLLGNVANLLSDELGIGSAGLLRGGAQAWVQVEVPDNISTPEGVTFRPNLLAATSFDGSLSTTYRRTATIVVCDNTMAQGLGEPGNAYKVKHSRYSNLKIEDARHALKLVETTGAEFTETIAKLCAWPVTNGQWSRLLDQVVPVPGDKGRSQTMATNKRRQLAAPLPLRQPRRHRGKGRRSASCRRSTPTPTTNRSLGAQSGRSATWPTRCSGSLRPATPRSWPSWPRSKARAQLATGAVVRARCCRQAGRHRRPRRRCPTSTCSAARWATIPGALSEPAQPKKPTQERTKMNSTVITGNLVRDPELRVYGLRQSRSELLGGRQPPLVRRGDRRTPGGHDLRRRRGLGGPRPPRGRVAPPGRPGHGLGAPDQRSWQTDQGERRSKLELTAADVAASLRWVTLVCLRPEYGPELSQDQDYEYDRLEEGTAEPTHAEASQVASDRPPVPGKAVAGRPVAQPAQQPASPPPHRAPAKPTSDLGR